MWMEGYDFRRDGTRLQLSENPYGSDSWRAFDGHNVPYLAAGYLDGTEWSGWKPRDNQHGWFYHIEEYYLASADPWVRDWYEFIKEFRKRTLFRPLGLFWPEGLSNPLFEYGFSTRGEAHMLANSLQAYRVTGDPELMEGIKHRIDWMRAEFMDMRYGSTTRSEEAAFHVGYLARSVEGVVTELKGGDPEYEAKAFLVLWGLMDWNFNQSQYSYYMKNEGGSPSASSGSSLTLVDPTAVWYLWSGQRKHFDLMVDYIENGLRGGRPPYGRWDGWNGNWEGRAAVAVRQQPKADERAASAVTDLAASSAGGKVTATWTAPAKAQRYLVVWSTKPIARSYDFDVGVANFWAANPVGNNLEGAPGTKQSLTFDAAAAGTRIYIAVATLTAERNLSEISNVASVTIAG